MAKPKFYVVWKGRQPGIYPTWAECAEQVNGYPEAKYKSFPTEAMARAAFENGWQQHVGKPNGPAVLPPEVIRRSICVDAACRDNQFDLEYRGVETASGKTLFHRGPLSHGTNNLGEFLAIVEALRLLHKQGKNSPIYSDSRNALLWVKERRVGSKLPRSQSTQKVWQLADEALAWLKNNHFSNPLLKWKTGEWGQIPADFGRK